MQKHKSNNIGLSPRPISQWPASGLLGSCSAVLRAKHNKVKFFHKFIVWSSPRRFRIAAKISVSVRGVLSSKLFKKVHAEQAVNMDSLRARTVKKRIPYPLPSSNPTPEQLSNQKQKHTSQESELAMRIQGSSLVHALRNVLRSAGFPSKAARF